MLKHVVELERMQAMWRLSLVYWISKSTCTQAHPCTRVLTPTHPHIHTQKCVILIAFPQQQWFCESTSLVHYMYTAFLGRYFLHTCKSACFFIISGQPSSLKAVKKLRVGLQSGRHIWHFAWRPNYDLFLPAALSCHTRGVFRWNSIRLLGWPMRYKYFLNVLQCYTHNVYLVTKYLIWTLDINVNMHRQFLFNIAPDSGLV
jgi:hypothetical protein